MQFQWKTIQTRIQVGFCLNQYIIFLDVNQTLQGIDEEDSNAAADFSDVGAFDSDSQTFDRVDYKMANSTNGRATDFSEMRNNESNKDDEVQSQRDNNDDDGSK